MHHTKNNDSLVLHEVDDPIMSEDHFSKVFAGEFWNDASDARILEECFGGFDNAIDEGNSVEDGITGNEVFDVLKVVPGSQRPADLRHRAILSFSSVWVRTRPSATS